MMLIPEVAAIKSQEKPLHLWKAVLHTTCVKKICKMVDLLDAVHMGYQKVTLLMTVEHQQNPRILKICVSQDKHSVLDLSGKLRRQALPLSIEQSEALPLPCPPAMSKVSSHSLLCVAKHSSVQV